MTKPSFLKRFSYVCVNLILFRLILNTEDKLSKNTKGLNKR